MARTATETIEKIDNPQMLNFVDFAGDTAVIEVPGYALSCMPFEAVGVEKDPAFWESVAAYKGGRADGEPVSLRPGAGNKWIVDAHDAARFMAAKHVSSDFFANLLSPKIAKMRFVMHARSEDGTHTAPSFYAWRAD